jgi:hypothetical protein
MTGWALLLAALSPAQVQDVSPDPVIARQQLAPALMAQVRAQLKPHWIPPSEPDARRIRTLVRIRLARDGSLADTPAVIRQDGLDATNRDHAAAHAARALEAVRLAAPFRGLADRYYPVWKTMILDFNERLSR